MSRQGLMPDRNAEALEGLGCMVLLRVGLETYPIALAVCVCEHFLF